MALTRETYLRKANRDIPVTGYKRATLKKPIIIQTATIFTVSGNITNATIPSHFIKHPGY
jgi:hypothetical protein